MGLRIIYGKAGTGKSQFCFNEINKIINNQEKIYIITPEQFSFTAEQKLLEATNKGAVINAEVLTFNRMAYRVINEVGGRTKTNLTSSGKAMLIYSILLNSKDNLKFLNRSNDNVELIDRTITELKKHGIKLDDIKQAIEKTENKYLQIKLIDVFNIYEKYNENIQNKYIDENDVLDILSEKLEQTEMFNNSIIYIDEFTGFTKQEYRIIEYLLKTAKQVNISLCTDELIIDKQPDIDIFYPSKVTLDKIIELAKRIEVKIEPAVEMKEVVRFKSEELKFLERDLYDIQRNQYKEKCDCIQIYLANNPYSEIEYVAESIVEQVRDNNLRYKDISIITKNIELYSSLVRAIFNRYEIPVFIDEKKDLNQNILIQYILALLDIFKSNWSYESMFNYLKIGLNDIYDLSLYKLENYCLKYGIRSSKWYKDDWKIGAETELEELNILRKKIVEPLLKFKEKLVGRKTVENISKIIYEFLIENNINVKLQEKIDTQISEKNIEIANEYKLSWDIVIKLLDEIVLIFKDDKITFDKYMEIFKIGLQNSKLSKIPQTIDEVILGDIDRSKSRKSKVVYILGLNDGVFPSVNKNEGFLSDLDRKELKNHKIELAKDTVDLLYEDKFNIYKAFTIAEEKLYLSYVSTTADGKAIRPSILISKIKKLYPLLQEKSNVIRRDVNITNKKATFDNLLIKLREHFNGKKIEQKWLDVYEYYNNDEEWKGKLEESIKALGFTNMPMNLRKNTIEKMYGNTLYSTVSRLEQYQSCAFSFFLKYNLNLKDKRKLSLESLDTGSFMHDVIDEFFEEIQSRNIKLQELEEDKLEDMIEKIVTEKLLMSRNYVFNSSAKYKVLTQKLKQVIKKSMKYIVNSIVCSDFEVLGNEIEFTNKKTTNKKQYDAIRSGTRRWQKA